MPELKSTSLLNEEIEKYYADKKYDMTQVSKCICDSIVAGVDCNYDNLALALNVMKLSRNRQDFFDAQNNQIYDISTEFSKVSVKQIYDNDNMQEPVLLFFKNDETLPFFKVISYFEGGLKNISVETSNNPVMLAKIKQKVDTTGYNYIFKDTYLFKDENNILARKHLFTKSGIPTINQENVNYSFSDAEKLFFAFIGQKLGEIYENTPNHLNFEQIQMIKYFYDTLKDVYSGDNEFDFDDLIKILTSICFGRQNFEVSNINFENCGLPLVAENIAMRANSHDNYEFAAISKAGKPVIVKGLNSSKYSSIDIYDNKGTKLSSYMIYETDKGFTLFRSLKDFNSGNKNILDSCTLNMTDNILKFSAMGDKNCLPSEIKPIDIELKFKKSGEFLLSSTLAAEFENKSLAFAPAEKFSN